jgi:hypothetical protein
MKSRRNSNWRKSRVGVEGEVGESSGAFGLMIWSGGRRGGRGCQRIKRTSPTVITPKGGGVKSPDMSRPWGSQSEAPQTRPDPAFSLHLHPPLESLQTYSNSLNNGRWGKKSCIFLFFFLHFLLAVCVGVCLFCFSQWKFHISWSVEAPLWGPKVLTLPSSSPPFPPFYSPSVFLSSQALLSLINPSITQL